MAYYIIHHDTDYLKDDSVGFTLDAFTGNYSDRKTYSTESEATKVMNSLVYSPPETEPVSLACPENIKVVEE